MLWRWEQTTVEKTMLHFDPPALRLRVRDRDLDEDGITLRPCGDGGIYTRVDVYEDWIRSVPCGVWD